MNRRNIQRAISSRSIFFNSNLSPYYIASPQFKKLANKMLLASQQMNVPLLQINKPNQIEIVQSIQPIEVLQYNMVDQVKYILRAQERDQVIIYGELENTQIQDIISELASQSYQIFLCLDHLKNPEYFLDLVQNKAQQQIVISSASSILFELQKDIYSKKMILEASGLEM